MIIDLSSEKTVEINTNMQVDKTLHKHLKIRMPKDTAGYEMEFCFSRGDKSKTK